MPDTGKSHPVWEGHRQRLRQRMEREGWDALRPHEMVELVLNYAVPRQDLSDIARALVDRLGSVGGVFSAGREQLMAVEGMTPTLAEWVCLTGDLMRAYYDLNAERDIRLSCYLEVQGFLVPRLERAEAPALWVIYADFDFNLITYTDFGAVADDGYADVARQIMVEAINAGARYVYLVRLSADAPTEMSDAAFSRLEAVADALRAIDVDLVDCVLAGRGELISLRLQGRLKPPEENRRLLMLHERYVASDAAEA